MPRDWDRYFSDEANGEQAPEPLLIEVAEMCPVANTQMRALDLASGAGRHAIYLASLGWRVTAVDRSSVAIGILRRRAAGLPVTAHIADLEKGEFVIAPGGYDLICDVYYLQRGLFPQLREGVRPGGIFVAAIPMVDPSATSGPHNPEFLLEPGELRREFADWKILFYSEAPLYSEAALYSEATKGTGRRTARMIARRA